ncbi:MAG: 6,7-dimethyl-8-ribityllumazine synthase [Acidimicrobiia bacterium]|nr:6,7-dimethyl-8-ribityllumazine synthase [Acidimicrobiia bacterium]
MIEIEGGLDGSSLKVGVVVASWNQPITDRLLDGALKRLHRLGTGEVVVARVPGALELTVAARVLIESGCDAIVAIGTVVKGETDHYEIVVHDSNAGIARLAGETGVPIGNAILAVHDIDDAVARSGPGDSNKGAEAAVAAVQTANVIRSVRAL